MIWNYSLWPFSSLWLIVHCMHMTRLFVHLMHTCLISSHTGTETAWLRGPGKADYKAVQAHRWTDSQIHQARCSFIGEPHFIIQWIIIQVGIFSTESYVCMCRGSSFVSWRIAWLLTCTRRLQHGWMPCSRLHSPGEDQWKTIIDENSSSSLSSVISNPNVELRWAWRSKCWRMTPM